MTNRQVSVFDLLGLRVDGKSEIFPYPRYSPYFSNFVSPRQVFYAWLCQVGHSDCLLPDLCLGLFQQPLFKTRAKFRNKT